MYFKEFFFLYSGRNVIIVRALDTIKWNAGFFVALQCLWIRRPTMIWCRRKNLQTYKLVKNHHFVPDVNSLDSSASQRRYSATESSPNSSTVLRRVASFTLDRATVEGRTSSSKYTPHKHDFQLCNSFRGMYECFILPCSISELSYGRILKMCWNYS